MLGCHVVWADQMAYNADLKCWLFPDETKPNKRGFEPLPMPVAYHVGFDHHLNESDPQWVVLKEQRLEKLRNLRDRYGW